MQSATTYSVVDIWMLVHATLGTNLQQTIEYVKGKVDIMYIWPLFSPDHPFIGDIYALRYVCDIYTLRHVCGIYMY